MRLTEEQREKIKQQLLDAGTVIRWPDGRNLPVPLWANEAIKDLLAALTEAERERDAAKGNNA